LPLARFSFWQANASMQLQQHNFLQNAALSANQQERMVVKQGANIKIIPVQEVLFLKPPTTM
jgi:hypothetical protein